MSLIGLRSQLRSVRLNYLIGLRPRHWRLLRRHRVDPAYRTRHRLLMLHAPLNAWAERMEQRRFGDRLPRGDIVPPLFIVGHWRSGTTHLHNLFAQDTDQFAYPTGFSVVFPHCFLSLEERMSRHAGELRRPMDNVELSPSTPQEDEFALVNLALSSPYVGQLSYPRELPRYLPYLWLDQLDAEERARWSETLLGFLRKLSLRHPGRRFVLKSPTHTARVRHLAGMFPEARFVFIHRHPEEVFRSMRHMLGALGQWNYLQQPPAEETDDRIVDWYRGMHRRWVDQSAELPEGSVAQIAYDVLVRDPLGEMARLYRELGLPGFDRAEPKLRAYLDRLGRYERNAHPPLPPSIRGRLVREWGEFYDRFGYPT